MAQTTKETTMPDWQNADPEELEPHFSRWMMELTKQGLHDKGDIAIALAMLCAQIEDWRGKLATQCGKTLAAEDQIAEARRHEQAAVRDFISMQATLKEYKQDAERYRKRRDREFNELARNLPRSHTTDKANHARAYDAHSDSIITKY